MVSSRAPFRAKSDLLLRRRRTTPEAQLPVTRRRSAHLAEVRIRARETGNQNPRKEHADDLLDHADGARLLGEGRNVAEPRAGENGLAEVQRVEGLERCRLPRHGERSRTVVSNQPIEIRRETTEHQEPAAAPNSLSGVITFGRNTYCSR